MRPFGLRGLLFLGAITGVGQVLAGPLDSAQVGQWVVEKSTASGMTSHVLKWVSKVEGKKLTLRTQMLNPDLTTGMLPANEMTMDLGATPMPGAVPSVPAPGGPVPEARITEESLTVGGRAVRCKRMEVEMGGMVSRSWMSDQIPISGLARAVTSQGGSEVSRLEVVDFGTSGGADRPVGGGATPGMPGFMGNYGKAPGYPTGEDSEEDRYGSEEVSPPGDGSEESAGSEEGSEETAEAEEGHEESSVSGSEAGIGIGDAVAALWIHPDGEKQAWYLAQITDEEEGEFGVAYADGETGRVGAERIRPLVSATDVSAGDRVLASWEGKARLYPGEVVEVQDDAIVVRWDDGSEPSAVASFAFCRE